jgi:hypothetical protein
MMGITLSSLLTVGLAATASARHCRNLTVPVTISARNGVFDRRVAPTTDVEVTNLRLDLTQPGHNLSAEVPEDYATVGGTYKLAATYCEPDGGPGKALQILTHGIGFDRTYWDFPYHNYNYSYVNEALARGYSTFSYDRLSVGESRTSPSGAALDPVNEVQSFLEVAALRQLTTNLRNCNATRDITANYQRILHVGHSFGSMLIYGITALDWTILDGIALTAFSKNGSFVPDFVYGADFVPANVTTTGKSWPAGYYAAGSVDTLQIDFFAPGNFDPAILEPVYHAGQSLPISEFLTLPYPVARLNPFPGPVFIVTGGKLSPCLLFSAGFLLLGGLDNHHGKRK